MSAERIWLLASNLSISAQEQGMDTSTGLRCLAKSHKDLRPAGRSRKR